MKNLKSKRPSPTIKRREFLAAVPTAGLAVCMTLRPDSAEAGERVTNRHEPIYRETGLVEAYYRLARF